MTLHEAMKLALEALGKCESALAEELAAWDLDPPLHHVLEALNACGPAITALRQAIEQANVSTSDTSQAHVAETEKHRHEPVAYSYTSKITGAQGFSHHPLPRFTDAEHWDIVPLYTTLPQRNPLTDDEILKRYDEYVVELQNVIGFARAIEAAHGIKEQQK